MDLNLVATFCLIVGLEIVLGIDNILLISIMTDRLPARLRNKARIFGLTLGMLGRCLLLLLASWLVKLNDPVVWGLSWKGIVLLTGGGFLLFKAVKEIHHVVQADDHAESAAGAAAVSVGGIIFQIFLLDVVFAIDSVITAVGLTENLWVIYSAVILSFGVILIFSKAIADFIQRHVTLKILALSFLVTIGVTLGVEGLGGHVPKSYIYLPMGFALGVELLQMRFAHNVERKKRGT